MTAITLWGRSNSGNVQKVVWALEELELDYEHVQLGGKFGGLKDPDYLELNPNGLVPTLRDGELVMWESNAIVRYLCAQYASGLLFPVDPAERAIVDQWADWCASTFQPAWIGVFGLMVRVPPSKRDPALLAAKLADANAAFTLLNARLGHSPWLGGDGMTYADIIAGVSLYRWFTLDIERIALPHVEAWYERLQRRPAFKKGVEVSYEDLRARD